MPALTATCHSEDATSLRNAEDRTERLYLAQRGGEPAKGRLSPLQLYLLLCILKGKHTAVVVVMFGPEVGVA